MNGQEPSPHDTHPARHRPGFFSSVDRRGGAAPACVLWAAGVVRGWLPQRRQRARHGPFWWPWWGCCGGGPVVRVGDDGLTRERDEHCRDLSAWD